MEQKEKSAIVEFIIIGASDNMTREEMEESGKLLGTYFLFANGYDSYNGDSYPILLRDIDKGEFLGNSDSYLKSLFTSFYKFVEDPESPEILEDAKAFLTNMLGSPIYQGMMNFTTEQNEEVHNLILDIMHHCYCSMLTCNVTRHHIKSVDQPPLAITMVVKQEVLDRWIELVDKYSTVEFAEFVQPAVDNWIIPNLNCTSVGGSVPVEFELVVVASPLDDIKEELNGGMFHV